MRCHEQGLALVTVLVLLAVLLVVALVFSDKVARAISDTARAGTREQALQAAGAGIEWARRQLAVTYRSSSGWAGYLAQAPDAERYPAQPAFETTIGGLTVTIFLRDNPDGDGDPRRDNDLQLFVLARAHPAVGPDVLVESLCEFESGADSYRQAGHDGRRSGTTGEDGLGAP